MVLKQCLGTAAGKAFQYVDKGGASLVLPSSHVRSPHCLNRLLPSYILCS
jgi:hypothetical protein